MRILPTILLALLVAPFVAIASPTTREKDESTAEQKEERQPAVKVMVPQASIVLHGGSESTTSVSGFTDDQVVELLHYGRALRPGMRLEVLVQQSDRDKELNRRIERFQTIAKWKPVEPTIEVSFAQDGTPLVDGIEFSLEQLQVLLSNVRERQPGIVVLLVGKRATLFKHARNVISCAAKAGINTTRFGPEESEESKHNKAEQDGADQPATAVDSKAEW